MHRSIGQRPLAGHNTVMFFFIFLVSIKLKKKQQGLNGYLFKKGKECSAGDHENIQDVLWKVKGVQ